jgi:pimeloyl-ACP methyl ester carboxylesterase
MQYRRRPAMVLINGLAEQAESWFMNVVAWREQFDVHQPNLLSYEGEVLHRRIEQGLPLTVDFFVDQLQEYLTQFVQAGPYFLVGNSMGGKIAVEYTARYPDQVARLALLCPSGLSGEERLPFVEGVRRNDPAAIVESVFFDHGLVDPGLVSYYQRQFRSRRWRTGVLRTVRGTMEHRVCNRLAEINQPTLVVVGENDQIVDPQEAIAAAHRLPNGRVKVLSQCGHAPQMEKPDIVNQLVIEFFADDSEPHSADLFTAETCAES